MKKNYVRGTSGNSYQLGWNMRKAAGCFYVLCSGLIPAPREEQLWVKTSTGIWCSYIRLFAVAFDSIQGPAAA